METPTTRHEIKTLLGIWGICLFCGISGFLTERAIKDIINQPAHTPTPTVEPLPAVFFAPTTIYPNTLTSTKKPDNTATPAPANGQCATIDNVTNTASSAWVKLGKPKKFSFCNLAGPDATGQCQSVESANLFKLRLVHKGDKLCVSK